MSTFPFGHFIIFCSTVPGGYGTLFGLSMSARKLSVRYAIIPSQLV